MLSLMVSSLVASLPDGEMTVNSDCLCLFSVIPLSLFFFFANHLQLDELDTWGLAFFLILYFACDVNMEVSFTETLDSPYILHYKTRQWYILIWFCALKLILSKTLWLINPDGKCRNSLRQLGLSPLWQSINTFVVSCPVSYDFVDG